MRKNKHPERRKQYAGGNQDRDLHLSCVGVDRVTASHWLAGSVKPEKDPMARPGFQLPESICLDGYISTFKDLHVLRYFGNSLLLQVFPW